jgi:predicted O-methyltransferase YrrM
MRYDQLTVFVSLFKPRSIIEIGTNRGDRGVAMCTEALRHRPTVSYTGYDVFDTKDQQFHDNALNGKGFFSRDLITRRFEAIVAGNAGFKYSLIEGTTSETLHKKNRKADFVFIDGDHRKEVIKSDYLSVMRSNVIVFDDYYSVTQQSIR